ncbi:MAG: 50S ribosomal protein L4 [Ruminococcaceae bacterium]|jgi:large subunit ribosomal protein L4|nr:50S ribosomal protein L4 [Oscillospiraceae bacterium]
MAKFDVLDMSGKKVSTVELSDAIFGIKPNERVMHAAVVNFLANQRQGTQSTLTRAEVSGGGRKPWRQKGTGRARQGSIRSPQWTHGGIALGPKPRDYSYRLNKKVRRLAVISALSSKAASGDIVVIDTLAATEYKTKTVAEMLTKIGATRKALIVTPAVDKMLVKSASNIPGVKTTTADNINTYDVLNGGKFVISVDAAKKLEEVFA